jgi:chemotaxis protein MotB
MSSVDQKKYDELQKTAAKQFKSKTEYHSPAEDVAKDITDRLIKSGLKMEDVELKQTLDGIQISMRGTTFFESGKTNLLPKGAKFIDEVGQSIIQASLPYEVRVEGHTDDVPISGPVFSSNWDLSSARASGVVQQLEFKGIASNRLVAMGYGDSRPLVPNRSPEGVPILENRAKNRRVVISISFFGSK